MATEKGSDGKESWWEDPIHLEAINLTKQWLREDYREQQQSHSTPRIREHLRQQPEDLCTPRMTRRYSEPGYRQEGQYEDMSKLCKTLERVRSQAQQTLMETQQALMEGHEQLEPWG
ncbi:uncharacterized, partial [Tachysurus ichikawai]